MEALTPTAVPPTSASDAVGKDVSLKSSMQKKWHPLTFTEHLQRPNCGYENSEDVGGAFQQWRQRCKSQATFWMAMHSYHAMEWKVPLSAHPHESANNGDYI